MKKTQKSALLGKIRTPRTEHVYLRQRLFSLLDQHSPNKPITWISAPAGAGKTTLIASYLSSHHLPHIWYQLDKGDADPASFFQHWGQAANALAPSAPTLPLLTAEYLSAIGVFAQNFFRDFYSQLATPFALVLDNYQDIPDDAIVHEMLASALSEAPKGVSIYILSREYPPALYARLQAHGEIQMLDWDTIKLTKTETADLITFRTGHKPTEIITDDLYQRTNGWVTGLVLLLEYTGISPRPPVAAVGEHGLLFDYFAEEILNRADSSTQQFLISTAVLPHFTLTMADSLLGSAISAGIIDNLLRKNYFIFAQIGEPIRYEYHPLFKRFLKSIGTARLSANEYSTLTETALKLLVNMGEIEAAALLGKETQNLTAISELITQHAGELIQLGKYATLCDWFSYLPATSIESNPWLTYWQAVAVTFQEPLSARAKLAKAYRDFSAKQDYIGLALTWSSIIDTYLVCWSEFISLDTWLDEIESQGASIEARLPIEIQSRFISAIFIGLLYRRPSNKNMSAWAEKVWKLFIYTDNSQLRLNLGPHLLMYFTWWIGDLAKAKTLLESMATHHEDTSPDPFHHLLLHAIEAGLFWMQADNQRAMDAADRGLALATSTGIHSWDVFIASQGVFGALSENDLAKANKYLELMKQRLLPGRHVDLAWYSYIQGWHQYLIGNKQQALAYLQQSRESIEQSGVVWFTGVSYNDLGRLLIETGESKQGSALLDRALDMGREMHSGALQYLTWLSIAEVNDHKHNLDETIKALQNAFAIGREYQIYNHAWWRNDNMENLYGLALTHGIETGYIKTVIRKRHLRPHIKSIEIETWPWPIKVYTLGRFSLVKDEIPVNFAGKIQKKPLELLKALIAQGGRDICDASLAEALWPDVEGDLAKQNLKTTIHRLRKLLHHDAIQWHDARLTLDPQMCWVDIWALERQINQLLTHPPEVALELQQHMEKIMAIYHGPFLPGDEHPYSIGLRERLRSKLLRLLSKVAEQSYKQGDYAQAIHFYQKGLELEILAEGLYQGLMRCYQNLGRIAEGLATYEQCRAVFKSILDIEPAVETTALANALRATAH